MFVYIFCIPIAKVFLINSALTKDSDLTMIKFGKNTKNVLKTKRRQVSLLSNLSNPN